MPRKKPYGVFVLLSSKYDSRTIHPRTIHPRTVHPRTVHHADHSSPDGSSPDDSSHRTLHPRAIHPKVLISSVNVVISVKPLLFFQLGLGPASTELVSVFCVFFCFFSSFSVFFTIKPHKTVNIQCVC